MFIVAKAMCVGFPFSSRKGIKGEVKKMSGGGVGTSCLSILYSRYPNHQFIAPLSYSFVIQKIDCLVCPLFAFSCRWQRVHIHKIGDNAYGEKFKRLAFAASY